MATITRDVARPAFLDRTEEGQLSLGAAVAAPRVRRRDTETWPLFERLRAERAGASVGSGTGSAPRSGGATLDELLVGAWEGLSSRHSVACPVCTATMAPRSGAAGGACEDCGAQLR